MRYLVIASVVCFYFGSFFYNIIIQIYFSIQSEAVLRSHTVAFRLNDLIVALIPAAILMSELKIVAKPKTYHLLRAVCVIVGVIALMGGCLFLLEIVHLLDYDYFKMGLAAHIVRQILIGFAAIHLCHRIIVRDPPADIIYV